MLIDYITKNGIYAIIYYLHNKCKSYQISLFNGKKIWIVAMENPFSNEYRNHLSCFHDMSLKSINHYETIIHKSLDYTKFFEATLQVKIPALNSISFLIS